MLTTVASNKQQQTQSSLDDILKEIWNKERLFRMMTVSGDLKKSDYNRLMDTVLQEYEEDVNACTPRKSLIVTRRKRDSPRDQLDEHREVAVGQQPPPCPGFEAHAWKENCCRNCKLVKEEHTSGSTRERRKRVMSTFKQRIGCEDFQMNFWAPHLCMNCGMSNLRHLTAKAESPEAPSDDLVTAVE